MWMVTVGISLYPFCSHSNQILLRCTGSCLYLSFHLICCPSCWTLVLFCHEARHHVQTSEFFRLTIFVKGNVGILGNSPQGCHLLCWCLMLTCGGMQVLPPSLPTRCSSWRSFGPTLCLDKMSMLTSSSITTRYAVSCKILFHRHVVYSQDIFQIWQFSEETVVVCCTWRRCYILFPHPNPQPQVSFWLYVFSLLLLPFCI